MSNTTLPSDPEEFIPFEDDAYEIALANSSHNHMEQFFDDDDLDYDDEYIED